MICVFWECWSIVRAINFASVVCVVFYNAWALQIDCTACVCAWLCMCTCARWAAPRLLSCMLWNQQKKITHILKLRRFANSMIYPLLLLFWSYCEEQWRLVIMYFALVWWRTSSWRLLYLFFFSEHREYFPNPCLSLPPITGANVILSIKLLTCLLFLFSIHIYSWLCIIRQV